MPIRTIIVRLATPISRSSVQAIDLGLVNLADVQNAGFIELIPATEGRLIDEVFFTPDGYVPLNAGWNIHIGTPNTLIASNDAALGLVSVAYVRDTIGLFINGYGAAISGQPGINMRFRDNGPLYANIHQIPNWYGPLQTWLRNTPYPVLENIIKNGFIQSVNVGGVSGNSEPTWNAILGGATDDGTVQWTNQGPIVTEGQIHMWAKVIESQSADIPQIGSLVFIQQPTDTVAEATMDPPVTVQILDQFGEPYTLLVVGVLLSILGTGTITGQFAETDPTTGIATFGGVSIAETGTGYVLRGRAQYTVNIDPVDSDPFDIT